MEQAGARAWRPQQNFLLADNKPWAQGLMGLIFEKAQSRLEIGDCRVRKWKAWLNYSDLKVVGLGLVWSRRSMLGLKKWTCSNPKPKKRQLTTEGLEAKFQSNVLRTDKHDHAKEFFYGIKFDRGNWSQLVSTAFVRSWFFPSGSGKVFLRFLLLRVSRF